MKPDSTAPIVHETAIVHPGVQLGDGVYIGPYCIIGEPAEIRDKWREMPRGLVIIGAGTILTGHTTIDSGHGEHTVIGKNCFIMKGVHVGHGCQIGDWVTLSAHCVLAGEVSVCNYANIGIGATIHQKVSIPEKCMIGQGATITRKRALSMQPMQTWAGNPARCIGPNKKWMKA